MSVAVCVLLLAGGLPASPTCVLKGHVRDARTGEPLVGASVVVRGTERGNATDLNGDYVIVGLPAMTGTATAAYVGYDDTSASLTTTAACTTHLDFGLRVHLVQLNYVPRPPGLAPIPPKPTPLPPRPQGIALPLPASSESRLSKYWGCERVEMSLLVIKQVGDSVLILTIGPRMADGPNLSGPSVREGNVSVSEFRTFWDSLGHLGFWKLKSAYSGRMSVSGETQGSISVSFEDGRRRTAKAVGFFAPQSCSLEFQQVHSLFESMARFPRSALDWRTLLRYETEESTEGLRKLYHGEALRAIAVDRDSEDLDTLLTMLLADSQYSGAAIAALGNIGSKRAVPALETFLARQEVTTHSRDTRDKEGLALAAAKVLVALNGRQSVPAIRRYLSMSYHRSVIDGWCGLLASVGDYSMVPEVLQILEDSSRYRGVYVGEAAETLKRIGYRSRHVISALLQAAQSELKKDNPDSGTMAAYLSTLRVLTGQEFSYHPEDSLGVKRSDLARWLKWWRANAGRFPAGGKSGLIQFSSTPSGAQIWLDGTNTGKTTPFVMFDVKAGRHSLRLAKERYSDWSLSVNVIPERATKVDPVLSKSFGSLQILSTPGAAIYLDGGRVPRNTPHLLDSVATGKHRLGLSVFDGYHDWDSTVMITHGETTTVRATLTRSPESLWITYAESPASGLAVRKGPERAVRFNARSEFGGSLRITKVSAGFSTLKARAWPDSSFRFRIYGNDGETLLYESPVLEAVPGEPGPAVIHELRNPARIYPGEFFVSVVPISTSGQPASLAVGDPNGSRLKVGGQDDASIKHSYSGSPGHWTPLEEGELTISVLARRRF